MATTGKVEKKSLVLVVEDDADIRNLLSEELGEMYEVATAANGKEAIEFLERTLTLPCIVFLDLMMPVMHGWEFLEKVEAKRLLPGVEIVILTAAPKSTVPKNISFKSKPISIYDIEDLCKASCQFKPGAKKDESA